MLTIAVMFCGTWNSVLNQQTVMEHFRCFLPYSVT